MSTRRETYIQALIDALKAASIDAAIERTIDGAFSRDEGKILVVHRGAETPFANVSGSAKRDCQIRLSTVTRGANPEADSDEILAAAHPIIMQFTAPGVLTVTEQGTGEPRYAEGNGRLCLITANYVLQYQTSKATLSS